MKVFKSIKDVQRARLPDGQAEQFRHHIKGSQFCLFTVFKSG